MGYTQTRVQEWTEVAGMDGEKIFAVGGTIGQALSITGTGGTIFMTSAAVPAGTLWVVCSFLVWDDTNAITVSQGDLLRGTARIVVSRIVSPPRYGAAICPTHLVLFPGDKLEGAFVGTLSGDTLWLCYSGYSMVLP